MKTETESKPNDPAVNSPEGLAATPCSPWVVQAEMPQDPDGIGLCLPTMESWNACHSLLYAPDGVDSITSEWVGFFINKEVAEKVKALLEANAQALAQPGRNQTPTP